MKRRGFLFGLAAAATIPASVTVPVAAQGVSKTIGSEFVDAVVLVNVNGTWEMRVEQVGRPTDQAVTRFENDRIVYFR